MKNKRKRSWEHIANNNRDRGSDQFKLDDIQQHLTQQGWIVHREPTIKSGSFTTNNHVRRPDLKIIRGKFDLYLELDGQLHGDYFQPTKKTMERNADYERAKMNYMPISEQDVKINNLNVLDYITTTLCMMYSKHLARLESGEMFV